MFCAFMCKGWLHIFWSLSRVLHGCFGVFKGFENGFASVGISDFCSLVGIFTSRKNTYRPVLGCLNIFAHVFCRMGGLTPSAFGPAQLHIRFLAS